MSQSNVYYHVTDTKSWYSFVNMINEQIKNDKRTIINTYPMVSIKGNYQKDDRLGPIIDFKAYNRVLAHDNCKNADFKIELSSQLVATTVNPRWHKIKCQLENNYNSLTLMAIYVAVFKLISLLCPIGVTIALFVLFSIIDLIVRWKVAMYQFQKILLFEDITQYDLNKMLNQWRAIPLFFNIVLMVLCLLNTTLNMPIYNVILVFALGWLSVLIVLESKLSKPYQDLINFSGIYN